VSKSDCPIYEYFPVKGNKTPILSLSETISFFVTVFFSIFFFFLVFFFIPKKLKGFIFGFFSFISSYSIYFSFFFESLDCDSIYLISSSVNIADITKLLVLKKNTKDKKNSLSYN